jgi:hypothetical protein
MNTVSGTFSWPASVQVRHPTDVEAFNDICAVQLPDRRILVVYALGNNIYEAYAPDTDTLYKEDDWVDDPEHTITQRSTQILSGYSTPRVSITEVDGEIYLVVLSTFNPVGHFGAWIFRRTGPGSWDLHGTVVDSTWVPSDFGFIGNQFFNVGLISVWNGIWIVPVSQIFYDSFGGSSFHDYHAGLATSSDGGVTWSWAVATGGGSGRVFQQARDVQAFNGVLYWSFDLNVSGTFIAWSTNGTAWTTSYIPTTAGPDGSMQVSPLVSDDNYVYMSVLNPNDVDTHVVYRMTDPLDRDTWEPVITYIALDYGVNHMQPVANTLFWADGSGRVVGVPLPGGCLPYEPTVGRVMGGRARVFQDMVRLSRLLAPTFVSQPRQKCAPCEAANARSTTGRVHTRLKKVF